MRVKQQAQQRQTVKVVIGELPKKRKRRARKSKPKEKETPQTRIVTQYVQQFPPPPNSNIQLPQIAQPNQPLRQMPERQPDDPIDLVDRKNFVLNKLAEQFSRESSYVPSPVRISEVPTPDFGIPKSTVPSEPGRMRREKTPGDSVSFSGISTPPIFNQASSSSEDYRRRDFERTPKKELIRRLEEIGKRGIRNKNKSQLIDLAMSFL